MGTLPIVDPDQYDGSSPGLSPGKSMSVTRPSVFVQLGLLDPSSVPAVGAETARKVLDPSLPSNELIQRAYSARSD